MGASPLLQRLMESGLDKDEFLALELERKRKVEEKRAASAANTEADGGSGGSADANNAAESSFADEGGTGDGVSTSGAKRIPPEAASKTPKKAKGAQVDEAADGGGASAGSELSNKLNKILNKVSGTQRGSRKIAQLFLQLPRPGEAPGKCSFETIT